MNLDYFESRMTNYGLPRYGGLLMLGIFFREVSATFLKVEVME